MRYRQFYIGLGTDTTAHHEHGADNEANIIVWCRVRDSQLVHYGGVEVALCPEGLRVRFYNAPGELVAELLNGILLSVG